jgi:hypothetical protein
VVHLPRPWPKLYVSVAALAASAVAATLLKVYDMQDSGR